MKDLRGISVSAVKNAIFKEFNLPAVDNKRKNIKAVVEWKKIKQVEDCYNKLYDEDDDAIERITKRAFPSISPDEDTFHYIFIYTAAVADIILNPEYPGIECARKPLERRYKRFKVFVGFLLLFRIKFIKVYRINISGVT